MSTAKAESLPLFETLPDVADGEVSDAPGPTDATEAAEKPAKKKPGPPKGYKRKIKVTQDKIEITVKKKPGPKKGYKRAAKLIVTKKKPGPAKQFKGVMGQAVEAARLKVANLEDELEKAKTIAEQVEHHATILESLIS